MFSKRLSTAVDGVRDAAEALSGVNTGEIL
jgi:hypothetical protein